MVAVPKPAELGFRWLSDAGQNQMCLRYHGRAAREAHPDERERTLSGSPGAAAALAGQSLHLLGVGRTPGYPSGFSAGQRLPVPGLRGSLQSLRHGRSDLAAPELFPAPSFPPRPHPPRRVFPLRHPPRGGSLGQSRQQLHLAFRGVGRDARPVLVVEHDEEKMRAADEIIELGPEAGLEGGRLLFQGTPAECAALPARASQTGPYLARKLSVLKDAATRTPDGAWLTVREASEHNLRGIDVQFPAGLLTCVTGVSGSGKSTLVNDVLAAAAARRLNGAKTIPGKHRHIENLDFFEKLVQVDQEPIGRSPRSNPATFTGLLDLLRDLFAQVPLARVRGYKASRFSFNVRGGRCERCQGEGVIKLDMQFMADAYAPCTSCGGRRYNRETLEVLFHGKSIADVLDMTVREAIQLFRNIPRVIDKLQTLDAVGLGYLALGQSAVTLSGGEAQRLKLSLELSKRQQGANLYILDEPTTGLHWVDIQRLMDLLFRLRDAGNTILVIEHNLSVINLADWIIDLGRSE